MLIHEESLKQQEIVDLKKEAEELMSEEQHDDINDGLSEQQNVIFKSQRKYPQEARRKLI
jgi:hypothetical protein